MICLPFLKLDHRRVVYTEQTETAEKDQRYKIGMCVLEAVKLTKSGWDKDDLGNNETTNSGDG